MQTHPHSYPEADDDESWDLQFDGESVEEAGENDGRVPFRPIGIES